MKHSNIVQFVDGVGIENRAINRLRELLEPLGLSLRRSSRQVSDQSPWDIFLRGEGKGLSVEFGICAKSNAEPRRIYEMIGHLQMLSAAEKKVYSLFFAPYISERAAQLCQQAGIGYFDEVGNCWISYETLLISKSVQATLPAPRRQTRQLFAPKSLRVARALLCNPRKDWRQIELSRETGISLGLVNRIVRRLAEGAFVKLIEGHINLEDPKGLLDEWVKASSLQGKEAVEFYTSESFDEVERRLDQLNERESVQYALALFAGAKYRAPFVRAVRLHVYLDGDIEANAQKLGLKRVSSGGNVFILPVRDKGLFYGKRRVENRWIVSDVQLYVDLKNASGRGEEQAEAVAEQCLQPILREDAPTVARGRTIDEEAKLHEFLKLRDKGDRLLFQAKELEDAAPCFEKANDLLADLAAEDRRREQDFLRFKLWLARLGAAFRTLDEKKLRAANQLFPSDESLEELRRATWFNGGWIRFGQLLKSALEAKLLKDQAAKERFEKLYVVVTSPYAESANELRPLVEEVKKWLQE